MAKSKVYECEKCGCRYKVEIQTSRLKAAETVLSANTSPYELIVKGLCDRCKKRYDKLIAEIERRIDYNNNIVEPLKKELYIFVGNKKGG